MKNEIFTNENKGFSLVELIVVIAIMAVMTSVLAPSLLGYVEQSRMAKDDSAMGEVNNAIKLALADQNVYDECLAYNVTNNYSCYLDNTAQNVYDDTFKVVDKDIDGAAGAGATDWWHWNDDCRMLDETEYTASGNMRGMTITFTAARGTNTAEFKMANARINNIHLKENRTLTYKYNPPAANVANTITLQTMTSAGGVATAGAKNTGMLYNKLRAVIGDSIVLSSQTYRNSEYTVFIRMGSMGGNNAGAQDAVAVYGQWSGTNLTSVAAPAGT